jgi:hypothetical protein
MRQVSCLRVIRAAAAPTWATTALPASSRDPAAAAAGDFAINDVLVRLNY